MCQLRSRRKEETGIRPTVNVTKAARFTFLCMMKTTRPVDRNVALISVEARRTFHGASCADSTELKKTVKHRAVITNVITALFLRVLVHIIGCNFGKKIYVFIGMKLGHLKFAGGFRAL